MLQAIWNTEMDIISRECAGIPSPQSVHGMAALDSLKIGVWEGEYL